MNIIISANNNTEVLLLPVVPQTFEVGTSSLNEEFLTNNGTLNLIGTEGLRTLSLESIFPLDDARWRKAGSDGDGWKYVEFLNKWRIAKVPIRIIAVTKNGKEWLNMAVTVESFIYGLNRLENLINYSLELKEYQFVKGVSRG